MNQAENIRWNNETQSVQSILYNFLLNLFLVHFVAVNENYHHCTCTYIMNSVIYNAKKKRNESGNKKTRKKLVSAV